jgi:hypothetical protein
MLLPVIEPRYAEVASRMTTVPVAWSLAPMMTLGTAWAVPSATLLM